MTLISDINTKNWSLSIDKPAEVVRDLQDLNQCIFIILMTIPGSDPLRPSFGCGVFQYIDKPINNVVSLIIKSVADAISTWETRVKVKRITAKIDGSQLLIQVDWESNIGQLQTRVLFDQRNPFAEKLIKNEYSNEYSVEYN